MGFYAKHVFICCNQRSEGRDCCNNHGAASLLMYMKQRLSALGVTGEGQLRINKAGCLGRCDEGPVMVIYPEQTWYTFVDEQDIDEIIDAHVLNGRIVERLKI